MCGKSEAQFLMSEFLKSGSLLLYPHNVKMSPFRRQKVKLKSVAFL